MFNRFSHQPLHRQLSAIAIVLTIGVAILASIIWIRQAGEHQDDRVLEVKLGLPLQASSALLIIALDKGFFAANRLAVTVREYPSGKRALDEGLFQGEVDLAGAADFPVAMAGLQRNDFRILASTLTSDDVNCIVARKNAGITQAADLRGKRIGVQQMSATHYFLNLFLLKHDLSTKDVTTVFYKAEQLPSVLADGSVDAISTREPFASQARQLLGDNAMIFSAPGQYVQFEPLLIARKTMEREPAIAPRILKALLQAEAYAQQDPGGARAIVEKHFHLEPSRLAAEWPALRLHLGLEQALLLRLEDEARWALQEKFTTSLVVPDYLGLIARDELQRLKPEAVTLY